LFSMDLFDDLSGRRVEQFKATCEEEVKEAEAASREKVKAIKAETAAEVARAEDEKLQLSNSVQVHSNLFANNLFANFPTSEFPDFTFWFLIRFATKQLCRSFFRPEFLDSDAF
jgi:hypothetical protein